MAAAVSGFFINVVSQLLVCFSWCKDKYDISIDVIMLLLV